MRSSLFGCNGGQHNGMPCPSSPLSRPMSVRRRVLPTARGWAETMVQQNVDTRVVLAFRVNPAALQKWLPTPWQIAPIAAGPSKDANLTISFIDRLVNHDREGKLIATGTTRLAALVVPAKQAESGGTALMDIREF